MAESIPPGPGRSLATTKVSILTSRAEFGEPEGGGVRPGILPSVDQIQAHQHLDKTVDTPYKPLLYLNRYLLHPAQRKWFLSWPQKVMPRVSLPGPKLKRQLMVMQVEISEK